MRTAEQRLAHALHDAVPAIVEADWADVRRRAAARGASTRRRLVAGVACIVAALAVAPATGVVGELRELLGASPAPPPVQTALAKNDEMRREMFAHLEAAGKVLHDRYSPVLASKTRGVLAVDTADGPIYLWVAPTEDGRQCWLIQAGEAQATGRPYGLGGCDADDQPSIRPDGFWTAERPNVTVVHARITDPTATQVRLELDGAADVMLPVVEGHVLSAIPKGAKAQLFAAVDADGTEVARFAP